MTTGDAEAVLNQLRDFDTVVASTASAAETRVRVLNASGSEGAAADTLADLTEQGFVSAGTGNAVERGTTEVRFRPAEDAKAALVASLVRGPVERVEDDSIDGADVVLVIGAQFEGITRSTAAAATPTGTSTAAVATQAASLAPIPGGC